MDKKFSKAFAEIIREEISRNNKVRVDGVGSFRYKHQNQFQKQHTNGRVVMMPPKDTIIFIPE